MRTIDQATLEKKYPLTYSFLQTQFHYLPKKVEIRKILESRGYSIVAEPLINSNKYLPRVAFHGNNVGINRYFYFDDFEPVSFTKPAIAEVSVVPLGKSVFLFKHHDR